MIHIHTEEFPIISYGKWGHGPAIILLHGFPENGELWRYVWPALSQNFMVLVPDLPGTGESTFKGTSISIEQLAGCINSILEKEGLDNALIAGHSMGGYIALAMAELYPEKVRAISFVHSTAFADSDEKKLTRRKSIELIRKGGKEPFINQMAPNLFSSIYRDKFPEMIRKEIERGVAQKEETMIAFYEAMANRPERTKVLKNSLFPMQWIIGKDDNIIPFKIQLQQCYLSNINFVSLYDSCGHMSMLEKPEPLANDLEQFAMYCYYN
ncbi:MAG TPA: alpha/beta hydrolase [Flavipsychrobacter sp.]|nr:alpha/beta hydrolase [Flavipsychrobacter sp.]